MARARLTLLGAALLAVTTIGAAAPAERTIGGDALIPVVVDGTALRLRAEPMMPGLPLIAPALAPRLGLKGGGLFAFGVGYRIGHETVYGRTQVAQVGWDGGAAAKRRVGWMSRAYRPAADGSIGPGGLPEPIVRFALHASRAGERTVAIPMQGGTGPFGSWFVLDGVAPIAGVPTRVRFDPYRAQSLVNAPAAVAVAGAYGGAMTATTGRQEIAFGIERPYRLMKLARPLAIGGLSLDRLGVRVTDEDVSSRIPEEGAAVATPDPDEVVVTARGKKPRVGVMILAADALAHCSSIVFDKPGRVIRLTCGGA